MHRNTNKLNSASRYRVIKEVNPYKIANVQIRLRIEKVAQNISGILQYGASRKLRSEMKIKLILIL